MIKGIGEKVTIGVTTALVLGGLALLWNWATAGGLVRAMGGVTQSQLGSAGFIPSGAILAFDTIPNAPVKCPDGWNPHRELRGRMVVGAGKHSNKDEKGQPLNIYDIGAKAGEEKHLLTEKEMPSHNHQFQGSPISLYGWSKPSPSKVGIGDTTAHGGNYTPSGAITNTGGNLAHNNMPPYFALLYCIKK